ncbi:MAG: NAD(P)/FAD-dependent oxidoreductase [Spirochaetaceae bacterium]
MQEKTRVVVLGAGYAGVEATKQLHKLFKRDESVDITLIDKNPYHTLMTELHEVAGSRTDADSVQVSLAKIFSGKRVNVVVDEIKTIDFENNTAVSEDGRYPYDYIIIGAGGEPEFFDVPGVQENCFTCWSLEDAIRIRTQVEQMFRDAAKEPNPLRRRRLLTFVIAGGGFTGVELAGELLERKEELCAKYHIAKEEVRVIVVEMMDSILPIMPPKLRDKASGYIRRHGGEILLNSPITKAEPGKVIIADEETLEAETFIWTAGIHGSEFTSKIRLTMGQCARGTETEASVVEGIHGMKGCYYEDDERYIVGERGRIEVNQYMQSVDFDNVYLAGDVIWYVHGEKPVPQIVENALQSGEVAAKNIANRIRGKQEQETFEPEYHGFMVSVGGRWGVAHVMGVSLSGMFAMAMKHLVNLHYLFGVAGINAMWEYLQHEFFTIRNQRSFIGGHVAWRIPVYWAFPLRIWLGGKWFYEGITKIRDGWLNPGEGGLADVSPAAINMPGVSFGEEDGGSGASPEAEGDSGASPEGEGGENGSGSNGGSDGDSGASPEAEGDSGASPEGEGGENGSGSNGGSDGDSGASPEGEWEENSSLDGADGAEESDSLIHTVQADGDSGASPAGDGAEAAEGAGEAAAEQASEWAEPLIDAIGPYTWFADNVLSASPLLAFLLQSGVVLAEVAIGLALVGGLFTFAAAGVSIILGLMFIASGWGDPELLWYIFASLVMLGGAGRGLGLDHYVMPALKRWWNRRRVAHKLYLYTGEPRIRN